MNVHVDPWANPGGQKLSKSHENRPTGMKEGLSGNFDQHCKTHLHPLAERFEGDRLKALNGMKWRLLYAIPACIIIVALGYAVFKLTPPTSNFLTAIIFATGMAFFGIYTLVMGPLRKYHSSVKQIVFPEIFRFFGKAFRYQEKSPLSVEILKKSEIFPSYDFETTEDYVFGEYKGVTIELMEVLLEESRGFGKGRRTVTVFKGIFILLGMNKNFSGQTIVKKDRGFAGNLFGNLATRFEKVALEDPVFEKQFEVYSSDQVEARYLLSTSFMERLLRLQKHHAGGAVQASFFDDRLLLTVPSRHDYFKTSSVFKEVNFDSEAQTVLKEMQEIFAIIDLLNLGSTTRL